MEFRPCIDIHNGRVKQIVGSSLRDEGDFARENYVAQRDADYFADLYRRHNLKGGHIILLNRRDSEYFESTRKQAVSALRAYPGGMQIGGGIDNENAAFYLDAGASHVIVTSFVFRDGQINMDNLDKIFREVGREHLVLDLSCRKSEDGRYYIVTDRWQRFTGTELTVKLIEELGGYADEFLVHAVDVEGKNSGIETEVVRCLAKIRDIPVTYAGGIRDISDLELLKSLGEGRVNATVGSALDLFGGKLGFEDVVAFCRRDYVV